MSNHIYSNVHLPIYPPIQALLSTLEKASRWAEALDLLGARELRTDVISYSAVISALEAWRVAAGWARLESPGEGGNSLVGLTWSNYANKLTQA